MTDWEFKNKNTAKNTNSEKAEKVKVPQGRTSLVWSCYLIGFYLLLAFTAYLFTWKIDQDKVFQFSWGLLLNSDVIIKNWLGRSGAIISHVFFYKGFGIASYTFVIVLISFGMKILKKGNVPFLKIARYSLFTLLWLPPALSFIFSYSGFPWGGAVGYHINEWLTAFLGNIGIASLYLFSLLLFLVLNFNIKFNIRYPFSRLFFNKENAVDINNDTDDFSITDESGIKETILDPARPDNEIKTGSNGDNVSDIKLDIETSQEEKLSNEKTAVGTNYDPTLDLPGYKYPSLDLLENYSHDKVEINKEELEKNKDQIIDTLRNYNIEIAKIKATIGPTVSLYEIVPTPGTRISKIKNLEDDIALSLSALGIRIIAPIPGKGTIGIEVPNRNREIVSMRGVLSSEKFIQSTMELPIILGKTISNELYIADLTRMPHLLLAGATGQGKSVGINCVLTSLLYKKHPSQLKFIMVDPKMVELSLYRKIEKHFLAKLPNEDEVIITDTKKVVYTLNSLCMEMDQRYELLQKAQVRNVKEYNEKFVARKLNPENEHRFLPYIILVVDEFADLIMIAGKEIESPIARLAQKARAIGIHLIIATQRPSVNIITGNIKANFPARLAFKVTSIVDSRTILDVAGADKLVGQGDMLFAHGSDIIRLQCPFVDTPEVERIAEFIGTQQGFPESFLLPEYIDSREIKESFDPDERDEYFEDAAKIVVQVQQGSTSLLQRRLKLGYNRAGRLMDQLENVGIVGPQEGSRPRTVLVLGETELEQFLIDLK